MLTGLLALIIGIEGQFIKIFGKVVQQSLQIVDKLPFILLVVGGKLVLHMSAGIQKRDIH